MMQANAEREIVLIVDDVPENLAVLSDALDGAGYMVLVAEDGHSALERLQRITPDIILLDAVMPGIDGFETCRRLKAADATRHIPVIFMTGLSETEHIVGGFMAGGVDYVTKPIRPEEVLARIATHLHNARLVMQAQEAIDAAGLAVAVVNHDGRCLWLTPKARSILRGLAPGISPLDGALHPDLHRWVLSAIEAETPTGNDVSPLFLETSIGRAAIHFLGGISGGQYLLMVEEQNGQRPTEALMRAHHLTTREVEVLTWVAKGKTNRDIGDILGMSPRTVNKHLEHIYIKLGVETRTAAAAVAINAERAVGRVALPDASLPDPA